LCLLAVLAASGAEHDRHRSNQSFPADRPACSSVVLRSPNRQSFVTTITQISNLHLPDVPDD